MSASRSASIRDWGAVRARIEASERYLTGTETADPATVQEVLRRRMLALANRSEESGSNAPRVMVTVCRLGDERYGIAASELTEIHRLKRFTPLPDAEPEIIGVVAVRGDLVSIVDLRRVLQLDPAAPGGCHGCLLLLRRLGGRVGLLVDTVEEIRPVPAVLLDVMSDQHRLHSPLVFGRTPDQMGLIDAHALLNHTALREGAAAEFV